MSSRVLIFAAVAVALCQSALGQACSKNVCKSTSDALFPIAYGYLARIPSVASSTACVTACRGITGATFYEYTARQSILFPLVSLAFQPDILRKKDNCYCYSTCISLDTMIPTPPAPLNLIRPSTDFGFLAQCPA